MRFLLLFVLIFNSATAQTITGTIVDENKQPMPGASVYLDGTAIGMVTDTDGTFTLTAKNTINTSLVVTMIGYESVKLANPFDKKKYLIILTPRTGMLSTVVIDNDGFTRKEKLKIFLTEFLGDTRAGRSCNITNTDDLNFLYNKTTHKLTATSDQPLQIENPYLGYKITFTLLDFNIQFSKRSLDQQDIVSSFYAGTSSYTAMQGEVEKYKRHRLKSFQGSSTNFFRDLCHNSWGKQGFILYNGSWPTNPEEHFAIEKTAQGYLVRILFPNAPTGLTMRTKSLNTLYRKKEQSALKFEIAEFNVDAYGNTNTPYDILLGGHMSRFRVGDLLPLDYEEGQ